MEKLNEAPMDLVETINDLMSSTETELKQVRQNVLELIAQTSEFERPAYWLGFKGKRIVAYLRWITPIQRNGEEWEFHLTITVLATGMPLADYHLVSGPRVLTGTTMVPVALTHSSDQSAITARECLESFFKTN